MEPPTPNGDNTMISDSTQEETYNSGDRKIDLTGNLYACGNLLEDRDDQDMQIEIKSLLQEISESNAIDSEQDESEDCEAEQDRKQNLGVLGNPQKTGVVPFPSVHQFNTDDCSMQSLGSSERKVSESKFLSEKANYESLKKNNTTATFLQQAQIVQDENLSPARQGRGSVRIAESQIVIGSQAKEAVNQLSPTYKDTEQGHRDLEQDFENEFKELHNATMYIDQDSMLVSQTEFIDMNVEPLFKMKAPVLDSILEERVYERERLKSSVKIYESFSQFTHVTDLADPDSNIVS